MLQPLVAVVVVDWCSQSNSATSVEFNGTINHQLIPQTQDAVALNNQLLSLVFPDGIVDGAYHSPLRDQKFRFKRVKVDNSSTYGDACDWIDFDGNEINPSQLSTGDLAAVTFAFQSYERKAADGTLTIGSKLVPVSVQLLKSNLVPSSKRDSPFNSVVKLGSAKKIRF